MSLRPGKVKGPYVGPTSASATGDHKVLTDATDTTAEYLSPSLIAGTNVTLTIVDKGAGNNAVQIDAATSPDIKAKVSAADTTSDYLNSKIVAGTNVTKTILNPGVNETLEIKSSDTQVKASAGDTTPSTLDNKMVAGTNITITKLNPGANESLSIAAATSPDIKAKVSAADTTSDYLNSKIVAGTNITKTILNPGANETLEISAAAPSLGSSILHSTFLNIQMGDSNGGSVEEIIYGSGFPGYQEYVCMSFPEDQDYNSMQWIHALPKNWKISTVIKCRLYWCVTGEGSHGTDIKWQISIRAIGNAEALSYNNVWVDNTDVDAANDVLYITDQCSITPEKAGSLAPLDMLSITVRRNQDDASGPAKLFGILIQYEIDSTIAA